MNQQSFEKFLQLFEASSSLRNILLSVVVLMIYWTVRALIIRKIRSSEKITDIYKAELTQRVSSYSFFIALILLFTLWFAHLQAVILSLFAIAAAVVLAMKELIMCLLGGVLIKINNYFRVGDRVEIDGVRGYVLESNLTSTRILEIGPEKASMQTTGNVVSIPNSSFLSKNLRNESFFSGYSIKSFIFPIDKDNPEMEQKLLAYASDLVGEFVEPARTYIEKFCRKEGILIPDVVPRTKYIMNDSRRIDLMLKIPVPNLKASEIEQQIFGWYMQNAQKPENA